MDKSYGLAFKILAILAAANFACMQASWAEAAYQGADAKAISTSASSFMPVELGLDKEDLLKETGFSFVYRFGGDSQTVTVVDTGYSAWWGQDTLIHPVVSPQSFILSSNDPIFIGMVTEIMGNVDLSGDVPQQINDMLRLRGPELQAFQEAGITGFHWRGTDSAFEAEFWPQYGEGWRQMLGGEQTFGQLVSAEYMCLQATILGEASLEAAGVDARIESGYISPEGLALIGNPLTTPQLHMWVTFTGTDGQEYVMDPVGSGRIMLRSEFLETYIVGGAPSGSMGMDLFEHTR